MTLDEFNKSKQNDPVIEEDGQKSVATQTSPISEPAKKDTWRSYYFDLMDRIQKTMDEYDNVEQQKPSGIEEGASKIWCKCFKCGEKNWYRVGPFKSADYISCDYCGGDLYDLLDAVVESNRVFSRGSE